MAKSRNRKKKKKIGNRSFLKGDKLIASIIKSKARSFELYKCYGNETWDDFTVIATIAVVKKYGQDKYCMGTFLVDPGCLGLKNTFFRYNLDLEEVEEMIDEIYRPNQDCKEIEYDVANELVWGAIEYADSLGFKPNKDFKLSQYFLCAQKDVTDKYELEFGVNGKPFYFAGPHDDYAKIIKKLEKKVGKDGFDFVHPFHDDESSFGDFFGEDEEDDDENNDFAEDAEVEYLD